MDKHNCIMDPHPPGFCWWCDKTAEILAKLEGDKSVDGKWWTDKRKAASK